MEDDIWPSTTSLHLDRINVMAEFGKVTLHSGCEMLSQVPFALTSIYGEFRDSI